MQTQSGGHNDHNQTNERWTAGRAGDPKFEGLAGTDVKPEKPAFGLCRCGQSKNKPFCNGSHSAAGFSSDHGDAKVRNTPIQYTGQVEGKIIKVS